MMEEVKGNERKGKGKKMGRSGGEKEKGTK